MQKSSSDTSGRVYIHKCSGLSGNHADIVVSLRKIEDKKIVESSGIRHPVTGIRMYERVLFAFILPRERDLAIYVYKT